MNDSIALIRVLGFDRYDMNSADYSLGLRYLESIVRKNGIKCDVYDPYDFHLDRGNTIIKNKYSIVGFTTHIFNIEDTLNLSKFIKSYKPSTYIILGGHHATATANEILLNNNCVDAVCCGEGEEVMDRITKMMIYSESRIFKLPKGILKPRKLYDLDQLDFPSAPKKSNVARLSTSRGCPYNCSFCTTPAFYHNIGQARYRCRSANSIYKEMADLRSKGYRNFKINDDIFVVPSKESKSRLMNLSSKLNNEKLNISYEAEVRIDAFTYDDLVILFNAKKAGLRKLFLGIESGSQKILNEFNKKITNDQCQEAIRLFNKVGIVVSAGNILVSPDSDINDICDSIIGFKCINLAYLFFRRVSFRVHCFPGTTLESKLIKENRLENKLRYLYRKFYFSNSKIEDIVCLFEESMPYYIQEIGSNIFNLRKKLLIKHYEEKLPNDLLHNILCDYSNISADILIKWFKLLPDNMITEKNFATDFNKFIDRTKEIYNKMQSFDSTIIDKSKNKKFMFSYN